MTFGLTERLKKASLRCGRNANTGVFNLESYRGVRQGLTSDADTHDHLTLSRHLDGRVWSTGNGLCKKLFTRW
jgi:hypothetical protein